ncbi:MAG: hypothetical protein M3068_12200 [Gemmatimonadota bacterium]|nr:hypothetical protein [Gemmatimonadota bacterium]
MRSRHVVPMSVAALFLSTATLPGQAIDLGRVRPPSRWQGGLQLEGAQSTGEFRRFVSDGYGVGLNLLYQPDRRSALSLRAGVDLLQYGRESRPVCFTGIGCRIALRLATDNNILIAGIGPQLMAPTGQVRPYASGLIGVSYFFTESSLSGNSDSESFGNTTNYSDAAFAWSAGGGLYVLLRQGRHPISLDVGGQYHDNGTVSYLLPGGVRDNPDGSISVTPVRSKANMVIYRIGAGIGF